MSASLPSQDSRLYLEEEVRRRARHATAEDVRITCSFARAERLLGREYHGRFLIELLQNAADAWRNGSRRDEARSKVAIVVGEGPALLVANQGQPLSAQVVIESLGHIGASTKAEGHAIGHKGIGFKSVLEVTDTPEIYSGLQAETGTVSVRFDPALAKAQITDPANSPDWDQMVAAVQSVDADDEFAAIPTLRFPQWVDKMPREVEELKARGFDTVVRLPFAAGARHRLSEAEWLEVIRAGLEDVTDQILVLLGTFGEIAVEDRLAGDAVVIQPRWDTTPATDSMWERVEVLRNEEISSEWLLARDSLPSDDELGGEVALGMRVSAAQGETRILPAMVDSDSAPFHLFFPTRIPSGLPFLLHGYFTVDAARTGFYRGFRSGNQLILAALADLVVRGIGDLAADESVHMSSLVNVVAACDEPSDELALEFRSEVLRRLDEVEWIPAEHGSHSDPPSVLALSERLNELIRSVFPAEYVRHRADRALPDAGLTDRALEMIRRRRLEPDSPWDIVGQLARPGDVDVWDLSDSDDVDRRLLGVVDLFAALAGEDQAQTRQLLASLRGDDDSRILAVVDQMGARRLLPLPDPQEGVAGSRSTLIMARIRGSLGGSLVPPAELDLAFLPDGLLGSESEVDRARLLGIRPYTVDNVLDRFGGVGESSSSPELLKFAWGLLSRERRSGYGTRRSAAEAAAFDPSAWFWCQPGRAQRDETSRLQQQRLRFLSEVKLPSRSGSWQAAGSLAFGSDWADWLSGLEGSLPASTIEARQSAYRDLESLSPGPERLLAPPHEVLGLLTGLDRDAVIDLENEGEEEASEGEGLGVEWPDLERHAFLLRLGVWEVPPVEALASGDSRGRDRFPWMGEIADMRKAEVDARGGWTFGSWTGGAHKNAFVTEDYRFSWPLEDCARRDGSALARSLQRGLELYRARTTMLVACNQCTSGTWHTSRYSSSSANGFPSLLAVELRHARWISTAIDGNVNSDPVDAKSTWWLERPPSGGGRMQSPWRLVPICGPHLGGITRELRVLAGVNAIDDAGVESLHALLSGLRERFDEGALPVDPLTSGTGRQAFIRLHTLAYERLAELDDPGAAEVLDEVGVLAEQGDRLTHMPRESVRHDDGTYAPYLRHFHGQVAFAALPRDAPARVRDALGIEVLKIELARRGSEEGEDVTDQLHALLADRQAEMLAILVHHSLGTQTLTLGSQEFERRARRLAELRIKRLPDLVVEARVEGTGHSATLGEGADQDVFLDGGATNSPTLFHDFAGDGWQDRLRRKLAPHLATLLENVAYTHTLALFLQAQSDAEREDFLLELGISHDEVDIVRKHLGVASAEEQIRHERWFRSILAVAGGDDSVDVVDLGALHQALVAASIPDATATQLIEAGVDEPVRRDVGEYGVLQALARVGVDLGVLDRELRDRGDESGLTVDVARRALRRWTSVYGSRVIACLAKATGAEPEVLKKRLDQLAPPARLRFDLEPDPRGVVEPIAELMIASGLNVTSDDLAANPAETLARLGGFLTLEDLATHAAALTSPEERARLLRNLAASWKKELRFIGVLAAMGPGETRSSVRALDDKVAQALSDDAATPEELVTVAGELLASSPEMADWVTDSLRGADFGSPRPDRAEVVRQAASAGIDVTPPRLTLLEKSLDRPRLERARAVRNRAAQLASGGVRPKPPRMAWKSPSEPTSDRREVSRKGDGGDAHPPLPVRAIKVDPGMDQKKRELGDEGEQWALAAVVGQFLEAAPEVRDRAVEDVRALLAGFSGAPVDEALSHASLVQLRDIDEEELIEELGALLHVARYSDHFGFDLIGWLPDASGDGLRATCLEVKSTGDNGFHLTATEWNRASSLHERGVGDRYSVLAVRRSKTRGVPVSMDLLIDPVALVEAGQLVQEPDGYEMTY